MYDDELLCYKVNDYLMKFGEAADICEYWGGSLVSIHSLQENMIIGNGPETRLIGLKEQSGQFHWNDGSLYDFENWGEDPGKEEDLCVATIADEGTWTRVSW